MNTLNIQRLLFLLFLIVIVCSGVYVLLVYVSVYYLSFEFLNFNKNYGQLPAHKTYNWLFVAYLAFVVLVRCHLFKLSTEAEYHLNTAEHLFFAFLICQTMYVYMKIFNLLTVSYFLRLTTVFLLLNLIGIINEYFQNFYQQLPVFFLDQGDLKDLVINFIGSSLFLLASILLKAKPFKTDAI